jgi:hypothetical protein
MADFTKTATLIMLADEACSRLRSTHKQAAAVKQTPPPVQRAADVADALTKAAYIRTEHRDVVAKALTDHTLALDMLEKLASRSVPAEQVMGQQVHDDSTTQPRQRAGSHDGTPAGDRFRAALMHSR